MIRKTLKIITIFIVFLFILLPLALAEEYPDKKQNISLVKVVSDSSNDTETKEWSYVASKKSKVFHRSDCRYVKKIKSKNLVIFTLSVGPRQLFEILKQYYKNSPIFGLRTLFLP
jgi:hypothetical protein